jgi:hypothetical protein
MNLFNQLKMEESKSRAFKRELDVIKTELEGNQPDKSDAVEVLNLHH